MTELNNLDFTEEDLCFDKKSLSAKERLIDFVKQTSDEELEYEFTLEKMTIKDGYDFLQRMRVELSRFRKKIIAQNRKPILFKMYKKSIEKVDIGVKIVLTRGEDKPMSSEMEDFLSSMSIDP